VCVCVCVCVCVRVCVCVCRGGTQAVDITRIQRGVGSVTAAVKWIEVRFSQLFQNVVTYTGVRVSNARDGQRDQLRM
jgi:hypothetical protein